MPARFILSLDCEGKWGVADLLSAREHRNLSDARLREAYQRLIALLDEFGIPATFAFVGLFAASQKDFRAVRPVLESMAARTGYLGAALHDLEQGSREGWHGAWALESVLNSRAAHEVALHGVTHVPWASMQADFFRDEMALVPELGQDIGRTRTFVFPRNEVAHTEVLAEAGFDGFRTARVRKSRVRSFLSEFNMLAQPEGDHSLSASKALVEIPSGYFLNWPSGLRRLVPPPVTHLRVKQILRRAARSSAVVHLWFHPENIASAPKMLEILRPLLDHVARARERGECEVLTQLDYCRRLRPVLAA